MKVWTIATSGEVVEETIAARESAALVAGGILHLIATRFFRGGCIDVQACVWEGVARFIVVDDASKLKRLPRNPIATRAFLEGNPDLKPLGFVAGPALIAEGLHIHDKIARHKSEIDTDIYKALRGCRCDYCVFVLSRLVVPLENLQSVKCPRCLRVSHHPKDIQQKYCAACNVFWGER